MEFYEVLRRLRCERGISQQALGAAIFIDQSVISDWETNTKLPNLNNLMRLADFFDVTIDQLVGRTYLSFDSQAIKNMKLARHGNSNLSTNLANEKEGL